MIRKLANYLIRPQRSTYQDKDLGDKEFTIGNSEFVRNDFNLKNERGLTIKCSIFEPVPRQENKEYDCIVFCHGNSGNRCSIFECLDFILQNGFIAVSFDFSGCGNSEGKYISLGHYEKFDIQVVVNHIRTFNYIGQIGLWGRSMGAASVLLYTELDQDISSLCLDSPFRSLKSLIQDFMDKFKIITNIFGDILFEKVSKYVQEEANLSIESVQPILSAQKSRISAIFIHAVNDKIINKQHSDDIVQVYKGRKKYFNVSGDHNDMRNNQLYEEVIEFFIENFQKNQNKTSISFEQISKPSLQFIEQEEDSDSQIRNYAQRKTKRSLLFIKQEESINQFSDDEDNEIQQREFRERKQTTKSKKRRETILLKNFVEISSNEDLDNSQEIQKNENYNDEESKDRFERDCIDSNNECELYEVNHRKKQQRKNMTRSEKIIIIQGDKCQSDEGLTSRESSPLPEDIGLIKFQSSKEIQIQQINDIIQKTPTFFPPNQTSFSQFSQSQRQNRQLEEELIPDEEGKNIPVSQDLCKFMYNKVAY
ncbi:hypothetical protein ABPG72_006077 [Tetrahymena utriculariae]